MKRDSAGKFTHNWDSQSKQQVCVSLTATAWQRLEEEAQRRGISRSAVIEQFARRLGNPELNQAEANTVSVPEDLPEDLPTTIEHQVVTILESISDAFVALAPDWHYTYVNQAAARLLQKTPEELLGKHVWREVFPSLVGELPYRELHRAVAEQVPVTWVEWSPIIHRWLEVNAYPSKEGIAVYFRDITTRKQAEVEREELLQALAKERSLLEAVLRQMPAGVIIAQAPSGKLILGNQQTEEIWRRPFFSSEDIEEYEQYQGFHPDGRPYEPQDWPLARSITLGEIVTQETIRFVRGDHSEGVIEVSSTPIYDSQGQIVAGVTVFQDITDRQQAEAVIRNSAERLSVALAAARLGDWSWDLRTDHVIFSERACELFGVDPHQSLTWTDLQTKLHPEDRVRTQRQIAQAIRLTPRSANAHHSDYDIEYRVMDTPDQPRWIAAKGRAQSDESGQVWGMLGVVQDITDRKRAEAERERLLAREQAAREAAENANRVKDEFLAVLSHELRSPLNPILGWVKLLKNGTLDAQKTRYALETIERNAQLQTQLIEDLLDVSRILQGKLNLNMTPVNLAMTLESALETVRLAAAAKSIQIQTNLDPSVGPVLGDGARLQQVMWNVLTNAIKFNHSGGQVKIQLSQLGGQAQIQVSDTGKGISADFLPYIFEYFRQADSTTTRQFGGLGLGLAIVRHLVELHGGTIQADSPGEDQGTTLTLQLPLLHPWNRSGSAAHPQPSVSGETADLRLQGIRVLWVDDEADSREMVAFILETAGAETTVANSARQALDIFSTRQPDIVMSDIGMPEMDGYQLIQHIRARPADQGGNVPAIALTAYAGEMNQQQAVSAGFQQHLAKPIDPELLVKAIATLVRDGKE